jgi:Asp-tRNA(Asn)/Glu-tRNA(Gln) amidotransferase A subunit family amidase
LAAAIRSRDVSPVEIVDAHLRRIEQLDRHVHAFVSVRAERAMSEAREAERELVADGPRGPLHGVPVAIKDEGPLEGEPTSHGLRALAGLAALDTGPDVRRLQAAGAIVLGKTNMPEFGHKGVTDNKFVGPTSSPFDLSKNAGGSSGGSAAAVGACFAPIAQGGDGGGSIRIPAALSGVFGLKASWGRVPVRTRPDAYAFALPMVSYGPLARTVEDAALMLQIMAGPAPDDPLSLPRESVDYVAATRRDMRGARVGYWPDFGGFPVSRPVAEAVASTVQALEDWGVRVEAIDSDLGAPLETILTSWKRGASLGYLVLIEAMREKGIDLLGEHADEISPSFLEYIAVGRGLTALEHRQENVIRSRVFDRLEELLARYDFIVTPTVSVGAVENVGDGETIGPDTVESVAVDPVMGWALCCPVNFTGHPAASVPSGFTREGHPVGLQVIGRRFRDDEVLALSATIERIQPWYEGYRERLAI